MKQLTLSIVIPVYNEEDHIGACLEAILAQTVAPLEVIVVDNNCTDRTVVIARTYSFVRIIEEPKQGRAAARNRGFNDAKGDIIGRIDADSILMPGWVERVLHDFQDKTVTGVTGGGEVRVLIGVGSWYSTFWTRVFYGVCYSYQGIKTFWGANMAIRRSFWKSVKTATAPDSAGLHEDQDLSFTVAGNRGKIVFDPKLVIKTVGGSYLYWPKLREYMRMNIRTKHYHAKRHTLQKAPELKLGFWKSVPYAIIGWPLTAVFIIYSLICWPIIALLIHHNPNILQTKR